MKHQWSIKSVAHICGREFYDVLPRGDIVMINVDIKKMHQKIKEGRQTSRKKKQFSDPDFQHKNIIFVARIDNKIARRWQNMLIVFIRKKTGCVDDEIYSDAMHMTR